MSTKGNREGDRTSRKHNPPGQTSSMGRQESAVSKRDRVLNVVCPHCGQKQTVSVSVQDNGWKPEIVECDQEDVPGCGELFGVTVEVEVKPVVWKVEVVK